MNDHGRIHMNPSNPSEKKTFEPISDAVTTISHTDTKDLGDYSIKEENKKLVQYLESLKKELQVEKKQARAIKAKKIEQLLEESEEKELLFEKSQKTIIDLENKIEIYEKLQQQDKLSHQQLIQEQLLVKEQLATVNKKWNDIKDIIKITSGSEDNINGFKLWLNRIRNRIIQLESTKSELCHQLEIYQKKISETEVRESSLTQSLEESELKKNQLIAQLNSEKESTEERIKNLTVEKENQIKELHLILKQVKGDNNQLKDEQLKLRNTISSIEQEKKYKIEELQSKIEMYTKKINDLLSEAKNFRDKVNLEIKTLRTERDFFRDKELNEQNLLHKTIDNLKSNQSSLETKYQQLTVDYKKALSDLKTAQDAQRSIGAQQHQQLSEYARKEKTLEIENNQLKSIKSNLEHQLSLLSQERDSLRTRVYTDEDSLQKRGAQITAREKQLTQYAEMINKTKQDLKEQITRIDYELQMAKNVNPINDYLKITEREIRRIDLQLKKTPAISKERIRLEECLDELFEQRDFLMNSSKKTTTNIDQRRHKLQKLLSIDSLQPSPPLPPKKR